ncbi:transposase [Yersinia enterocolitica subsp. palearctica YE-P4]|uniref:Transposase n=4 Tax=Yersinia enterocolitica TaxID=630 RepID=A0A0H3NZ11_YERE1|nr:transposase [Yersinia enterocolitica subsp. palearctica YE-149]EOR73596.1 transposase [Yersinia enterocolitica subsp. palearctica YE-150]EOR73612.1 transposase [Yersinia enterocolitica subsp. palearctica YE-P4]EOR74166.1 transposase [Yersinia enterocolitica subsp. palearctica YE-P1]OAM67183.1 transposase [Yersinia enterocolitica subsp. palearctica]CBY29049.1 transposase [Yersinia enterocolitica subsp. palearctica Y11]CNC69791.1 transposase [Yersinia enterocolitica]VEB08828.1 transposase [
MGISRQAWYQSLQRERRREIQAPNIIEQVTTIRLQQPRLGARKLHDLLRQQAEPALHVGRDRLLTIPGVGPVTASLLATRLGDGKNYASSRDFAASTGLVPRQYSTGGKTTLMGISKRGDKNLRRLLVQCARVFIQRLEHNPGRLAEWVRKQLANHHSNVVACALANKLARIAWAVTAYQAAFSQ